MKWFFHVQMAHIPLGWCDGYHVGYIVILHCSVMKGLASFDISLSSLCNCGWNPGRSFQELHFMLASDGVRLDIVGIHNIEYGNIVVAPIGCDGKTSSLVHEGFPSPP